MFNDVANFSLDVFQTVEFNEGVNSVDVRLCYNKFPPNTRYPIGCTVNLVVTHTMTILACKITDVNLDDQTYTVTSLDERSAASGVSHSCITSGFEESVHPYNRYSYECASDSSKSRIIKAIVMYKLQEVFKVGDTVKLITINDEEIKCEVVSVKRKRRHTYLYNLVSLSDDKAIINDVHHLNIMTV